MDSPEAALQSSNYVTIKETRMPLHSLLPAVALALLGMQAATDTKPTARIQIDLS
ncbi:MAG: hypothetical protein RJA02_2119, partial [Armatimonadota bacterium]